MTIEGYFDGTAVRTLKPVDLKPRQKVFVQIPEQTEVLKANGQQFESLRTLLDEMPDVHLEAEKNRKARQKKAVDDLFNLLSDDEVKAFAEAMKEPLRFKTVEP